MLDLWTERTVGGSVHGQLVYMRYADDFVCGFGNSKSLQVLVAVLPQPGRSRYQEGGVDSGVELVARCALLLSAPPGWGKTIRIEPRRRRCKLGA